MKYKKLNSNTIIEEPQRKILNLLYKTFIGRCILKIVTKKWFSKIVGIILNIKISKVYIKKFIKKNNINIKIYEEKKYCSFNDFFIRKLKKINTNSKSNEYISTAEAKLSCYKISKDLILNIKNSKYSVKELIQDEKLAKFEEMLGRLNESMPEEFKIVNEIEKLKYKIKKIKNVLVDYINNSQQIQPTTNFNQSQQLKVRRNSTIGYEYSSTNNNNNLEKIFPGPKNQKMDNKANDSLTASKIDRDITPSKAQKQNIK